MRLRNVRGSREIIAENPYVIKGPEGLRGRWQEIFEKENPLHIEIGMGKGKFIMRQAELNPDINYIGIEKYSSVLIRALEKLENRKSVSMKVEGPEGKATRQAADRKLIRNLAFIRMDAEYIGNVFGVDEVDRIYLNFSDPWPKDRHAKRRLTSRQFLEKYSGFLKNEGELIFKTDNVELFDFSLEEVKEAGWTLVNYTYDLHNSPHKEGNVMTEYEERFLAKGNKICRMEIKNCRKSTKRNR